MATGRRKSERSTRHKLSSPGRPPVWQRENLCRFWRGVAAGLSSEEAAAEAGVSGPVGIRWFRSSGGMPPTHLSPAAASLTSRNLTFREREEIALECTRGTGVRVIARKLGRSPSTISREFRRNSATRGGDFDYRAITAQWHAWLGLRGKSSFRPPRNLFRAPSCGPASTLPMNRWSNVQHGSQCSCTCRAWNATARTSLSKTARLLPGMVPKRSAMPSPGPSWIYPHTSANP